MALIQCPECGKSISSEAVVCPQCGAPPLRPVSASPPPPPPHEGTILPPSLSAPTGTGQRTSGFAVASMVLGIVDLVFLGWISFHLPAIFAVIFARISLGQIKKAPASIRGKGMAIAGLVLGYIGLACLILTLLIVNIFVRNFFR